VDIGAYEFQSDDTAPTIAANQSAVAVNEGSRATNSGTLNDAQGRSTVTLPASIGTVTQNDTTGTWSWSYTPPLPASTPVTITATDNQGFFKSTSFTLTVKDVAPTITAFNIPATGSEGSPVRLSATATDPGGALEPLTYTWTVIAPDGSTLTTLTGASTSFSPPDNGGYGVSLTVSDGYGGSATRNQIPPPGVVSWWKGQGNAADVLGANNGYLVDGVSFAPGEVAQAFSFNGTRRVLVLDSPSLEISKAVTMEAWVDPSSPSFPYGRDIIMAKTLSSGLSNYDLSVRSDGSLLLFESGLNGQQLTTAPGVVPVGRFTYVAATLDAISGTGVVVSIYVNGTLSATHNFPYAPLPTSSLTNLTIGDYNFPGGQTMGFKGLLDEPSLYNQALSASELQAIYNDGAAGKPLPIAVLNVAPTSTLSGPASGVAGQNLVFAIGALDPSSVDQTAGFAYTINWGDDSTVQTIARTENNGHGLTLNHVFRVAGTYTITLTATDKDGGKRSITTETTLQK
jgi:Concanavalin A-like lectin/glucanases superfamily/PKD domain